MSKSASPITLDADARSALEHTVRSSTSAQRDVLRARIVLAAADGQQTRTIAAHLQVRQATVSHWRTRFAREGMPGLQDAPRSGRKPVYTEETTKRILEKIDEPAPEGLSTWNGPELSKALGISVHRVWRVLRELGICLQRRRSWCISTDPEFAAKAADIVGLYLDPPDNAVVIAVDEKPHIQALERAQGYLKLPDGRAITGYSHEYKRNGTTTLFAALEVATGAVQVGHYTRRRRIEFLDFMNEVVANHPDKEIHVVLDNLNTHKPKRDMWLARHKRVYFHYTPTHASWLNLVECWFSILSRKGLRGLSVKSAKELREAIDRFIRAYAETAHPFHWTKRVVHSVHPKNTYAELRK
jgi:transposase